MIPQLFRSQAVVGTKLNGETPAVVLFTLRQVVEDLEDSRITKGYPVRLGSSTSGSAAGGLYVGFRYLPCTAQ